MENTWIPSRYGLSASEETSGQHHSKADQDEHKQTDKTAKETELELGEI